MLHGQDLSTNQVILIAVVGLIVVLFELGLLAFLISIFSKIINGARQGDGNGDAKKAQPVAAAAAVAPAAPVAAAAAIPPGVQVTPVGGAGAQPGSDEEVAAALAAVFAEAGRRS